MLLAGAFVGIVAGLLAQPAVAGVEGDVRIFARLALVLPALVFVGWWVAVPGVAADRDEVEPVVHSTIDVDARLDRIESTFDTAAVPRAGRHAIEPANPQIQAEFRRSIRRVEPSTAVGMERFGIRRPDVPQLPLPIERRPG